MANPAPIHEWCANRHERSADTEILPSSRMFNVRHGAYRVNGRVVATIAGPDSYVILWDNGLVEWLCKDNLVGYKRCYMKWWCKSSLSTLQRKIARLRTKKLHLRTQEWIAEHERIHDKKSQEVDFLDGTEFVWR